MPLIGPGPADDPLLSDLRQVVATLASELTRLQGAFVVLEAETAAKLALKDAEIVALKDEIARLKGLPPRPKFGLNPSGMERGTSPSTSQKGDKRGRGSVRDKLVVTSEVKLKVAVPPGSRFRGYEDVLVQDLRICVEVVRYRRERWETATGTRIVADLPPGILGGFGPELRRFIAAGHFQGQVTSERLVALLNGMGLNISGGTVSEPGKIARDTMLGLLKTCAKLGVSCYQFLGDGFAIPGASIVPSLPSLVRLAKA